MISTSSLYRGLTLRPEDEKLRYKYVLLVGLPGSGKDIAAKILENRYGFRVIVMSDVVREVVVRRGLLETRENFRKIGLELRNELGPAAVALLCIKKAEEIEKNKTPPGIVINGIRNIEEIEAFRERFKDSVITIAVVASKKVRFNRIRKRGRRGFDLIRRTKPMTYEEFLRQDREELELFDMGKALAWADAFIVNDGSVKELEENLISVLTKDP
ncbi:MAG TPA: dephospho-CoA kinase [Candidatus Korarchaeota archaeon]|nr:dephospho-CoA kinase [Candidatus Korarchaeota archaeon]